MNHLSMRTKSHWLSSLAIVLCLLFNPLSIEKSMAAATADQAADSSAAADSNTAADSKKEKAAAKKAAKAKAKADKKKKAAKKAEAKAKHEAMQANAEMQQSKADKKMAKRYSKKSKQEAQIAQDEAAQAKADAKKAKSGGFLGKFFGGGNSESNKSTSQVAAKQTAAKKQTQGHLSPAQLAQKKAGYDVRCCIHHGFIDLKTTNSKKTVYAICKEKGHTDCLKVDSNGGGHRKDLSGLLPFN